jgi:hypothetical protein
VTAPATLLNPCPAPTDDAGWLAWLQAEFPGVGFVHARQWIAVVGRTRQWSEPTAQELEGVLRRAQIPVLPLVLASRRVKIL